MATVHANTETTTELVRPLANFPPSMWGDRFLSFSLDNSEMEAYVKAMEKPKEDLRRLIINHAIDSDAKLSLIYSLYRLGLTYLFTEEIDEQLDKLFNELNLQDYHEIDLYTISVHFQVFRIHGYRLSCDVFNKFMDRALGAFKEDITTDVKGMLAFYESTQLRIRGEHILDEAFTFTKAKLNSLEKTLEGNLSRQVKHALGIPIHRGMPMVEARLYLLNYEEECSMHDSSLLKLAKVHFNYLQLLQKEELRIVSKWWKDMNFNVITPYARDRVPELYLWILGLCLEPYYSQARIITTKIITFVCVLDDTCDAYSTIEEFRLLTHALHRWENSAMEELPEYIKPFYKIILDEYAGFEEQLAKEGRESGVYTSKQAFQNLARAYLEEAEWRHTKKAPSFEDYTKNGVTTSSYDLLSKSALMGMGKIVTEEALTWYKSHPNILTASGLIGRLRDDLASFEFERERGNSFTSIEAYMKTYMVSEKVAVEEVKKIIENAWKDINDGCLKPREIAMDLIAPIVNLARMSDVTYAYNDGFTFPETFKEYINLLFTDHVPYIITT